MLTPRPKPTQDRNHYGPLRLVGSDHEAFRARLRETELTKLKPGRLKKKKKLKK